MLGRSELEKLVGKLLRLGRSEVCCCSGVLQAKEELWRLSNYFAARWPPQFDTWEEDEGALVERSEVLQLLSEYAATFEAPLRIADAVANAGGAAGLEGEVLFGALFDAVAQCYGPVGDAVRVSDLEAFLLTGGATAAAPAAQPAAQPAARRPAPPAAEAEATPPPAPHLPPTSPLPKVTAPKVASIAAATLTGVPLSEEAEQGGAVEQAGAARARAEAAVAALRAEAAAAAVAPEAVRGEVAAALRAAEARALAETEAAVRAAAAARGAASSVTAEGPVWNDAWRQGFLAATQQQPPPPASAAAALPPPAPLAPAPAEVRALLAGPCAPGARPLGDLTVSEVSDLAYCIGLGDFAAALERHSVDGGLLQLVRGCGGH